MPDENPYMAPKSVGTSPVEEAATEVEAPRLGTRHLRWIVHSQYALKVLYLGAAFFALVYGGQFAYVFAVEGPDVAFPLSLTGGLREAVQNVLNIGMNVWIAFALRRFDRALGQVIDYNGAPAAVYRALRMSRNAWFAMAASTLLVVVEWLNAWVWYATSGRFGF